MKAAIIGCGLIGHKRAAALPDSVELVGCFDTVDSIAQIFATEFGTKVFTSVQELLAVEDLDFVVVATRHDSLSTLALATLNAGKHVFIEKPGAINHNELLKVYEAAEENNLRVHIGYNHQYHPAISKAMEIFGQGAIGELMFLRGRYGHGGRLGYEKEWRADKIKSGGGELIDQGTHLIDLSLGFMGEVQLDYAAAPTYFCLLKIMPLFRLRIMLGILHFFKLLVLNGKICFQWKFMGKLENWRFQALAGVTEWKH